MAILQFLVDWGTLATVLIFIYLAARVAGAGFTHGFQENTEQKPIRIKN